MTEATCLHSWTIDICRAYESSSWGSTLLPTFPPPSPWPPGARSSVLSVIPDANQVRGIRMMLPTGCLHLLVGERGGHLRTDDAGNQSFLVFLDWSATQTLLEKVRTVGSMLLYPQDEFLVPVHTLLWNWQWQQTHLLKSDSPAAIQICPLWVVELLRHVFIIGYPWILALNPTIKFQWASYHSVGSLLDVQWCPDPRFDLLGHPSLDPYDGCNLPPLWWHLARSGIRSVRISIVFMLTWAIVA